MYRGGKIPMKKFKLGVIFSFILMFGSFTFPNISFASDSGGTAREVAQDATDSEWNYMKDYFQQTKMPADVGYSRYYQTATDFEAQCNDWQRNEYAYTGKAKRVIKSMTSSDPDTINVSYSPNDITIKRGVGTSSKVTIKIEYQISWVFRVKENVLGVWWSVNDQIGSTATFTDTIQIDVAQKYLSIVPKPLNEIQLNLFDPKIDNPLNFVDYSGNSGQVNYYMRQKPDDSKLGSTTGNFVFSDDQNTISVDIPFTVVDTTRPSGTLKDPIELEVGNSFQTDDFFETMPFDNDFKDVKVTPSIKPNTLGIGNYPFVVELEDHSGNITTLHSNFIVKDTTAPTVKTKNIVVDYGEKVTPSDFIESATDNDKSSKISFVFDLFSGSTPDTQKVGEQTVKIFATDNSGNGVTVGAKLTVNPDNIAPTGNGKMQFIEQNKKLPSDEFSTLENIKDNGPIDTLTAKYVSTPDTSQIGLAQAVVRLSDVSGNHSDIKVPVFVIPTDSVHDENSILSADNFTIYSDQVNSNNSQELEKLILEESQAKAWDSADGSDISSQIIVSKHNIQNKFGSYSVTLSVGNISKVITVNVLDSKDLVDVTLPKMIAFGSTDIDEGEIISPKYAIKNNSSVNLKISLEKV